MSIAFVALGSNLGDRLATINSAIDRLSRIGTIRSVSPIYETEPIRFLDQPPYLNAVAEIETSLRPEELLETLLQIERAHGRERTFQNAPRTLDLDLLVYDQEIIQIDKLTVPHPRLHERAFVLVPLNEIAPGLIVPGTGKSAAELLEALLPVSGVTLFPAV